ncbi:hypothetical protein E5S69_11690 [Cupriavidus necator]|uniref:hypothetical protein n=1 Tax=Cupriavidus necator TaxID=106590 RepID=UPI0014900EE0|nr:hypothetical protein [Cupriavidus necator]NOV24174.1 hypothetical protein [Cupriavidus necator]
MQCLLTSTSQSGRTWSGLRSSVALADMPVTTRHLQIALFSDEAMKERVLIGREEAAELLNLSVNGLIGRTREKNYRPRPVRQGRRVLYDLEEVMEVKRVMDWLRGRDLPRGS